MSGNLYMRLLATPRTYSLFQFEEEIDSSMIGILIHAAAPQ
jgi:hypothetical protein